MFGRICASILLRLLAHVDSNVTQQFLRKRPHSTADNHNNFASTQAMTLYYRSKNRELYIGRSRIPNMDGFRRCSCGDTHWCPVHRRRFGARRRGLGWHNGFIDDDWLMNNMFMTGWAPGVGGPPLDAWEFDGLPWGPCCEWDAFCSTNPWMVGPTMRHMP